nr:MAG TPA: hypothetical protein [Bacteriophage sp.]
MRKNINFKIFKNCQRWGSPPPRRLGRASRRHCTFFLVPNLKMKGE